jgi:hypothetical protein
MMEITKSDGRRPGFRETLETVLERRDNPPCSFAPGLFQSRSGMSCSGFLGVGSHREHEGDEEIAWRSELQHECNSWLKLSK